MPSDKHNLITIKGTGLIFSLFNIALAQEVPLAYCNAFFMDLPVSSFVSHSYLLTAESADLVVALVGFPS